MQETDFIKNIAEIGVIVLMFAAGLETDVQELKKTGLASFIIALLGVIVPLVGGYFVATIYNPVTDQQTMLQNIFVGVVLTATSVSITVETLIYVISIFFGNSHIVTTTKYTSALIVFHVFNMISILL